MYHTPVLLKETLELLALKPGNRVIDATLGDAGHGLAMLATIGPAGKLLGLDASPTSLERARARIGEDSRVTTVQANFGDLAKTADEMGYQLVDGIVFDLGVASWQLDEPGLGLSFQREEPLDMRLNPKLERTASDIVNRSTPDELTTIFEQFGDVRRARPIVERIRQARSRGRITSTTDLVELIGSREPRVLAPLFQALRIAVNGELDVLTAGLDQAIDRLAVNGRLVVMSYHSGEDRVVKRLFQAAARDGRISILTQHPLVPSEDEQRINSRSRSAKLRAVERI